MPSEDTRKRRSELGPLQEAALSQNTPKRARPSQAEVSRRGHGSPDENVDHSMVEDDTASLDSTDDENEDECKIAGRIVSVELEDFMCHKHLVVKFDEKRNCTYIGGSNGSGKSALFAAINLGLGGRGRTNDRGGSASAYIREGMNKARIIIILTNEGIGKHPDYADQISVRRTIGQKSSAYELRSRCSARDKEDLVSKRKGDLNDLCRRFNIDLENPIVWMSQDRSRQFLQDLQPKKLFNMFMESSKIGNCYQQSFEARAELTDIQAKLEDCKEMLKQVATDYSQSKKRMDATQRIAEKTAELRNVDQLLSWLPVKEKKELISVCEDELKQLEEKIDELKQKKESCTENVDQLKADLNTTLVSEDTVSRKRELEDNLESRKAESRELMKQKEEHKDKLDRAKRIEATTGRQCDMLKGQLADMKGIDYEEQKEKERQLMSDLQNLQQEEERYMSRHPRAREDLANMRADFERVEGEVKNLKAELRICREGMDEVDREKRRREDIRRDQESRFGRDIPRIKQVIAQNAHMFEKPPIGPIGAFISVTDSRWVDVVEYVLKRQVGAFLVNSGRDRKTFFELLQRNRINYKPPMVCQRFHEAKLNVRNFEPSDQFLTVLRVLNVTDHNVFNNLVDDCGAASVLLIESDSEARRMMRESPPENATKAITLRFGEAHPVTDKRPYRFYSVSPYKAQFLTARGSAQDDQRDFAGELEYWRNKHSDTENELQDTIRRGQQVQARLKNVETENREIAAKLDRIAEQRESIMPQLDRLTTQVDVEMLAQLETELNHAKQKHADLSAESQELREKLRENDAELKRVLEECNRLAEDIRDLRREESSIERQRDEKRRQINERMKKAAAYDQRIADCEDRHSVKEREIGILREQIARLRSDLIQRSDYQPDIANISSRSDLEGAQRNLKEMIRKYEAALAGPPMTAEMLVEKKKKLSEMKIQVLAYEGLMEKLRTLYIKRYKQLQSLVAHLTYKLQLSFTRQLALRKYNGTLNVDYKNRSLSVNVQTHKHYSDQSGSQSGKKGQDIRGLSGGERSYATASFVVALWECIESPFRLLDEFDVFMDMVNRRIVMEMLVYVATEKYNAYQFFFFTPQGIQDIQDKESVLIFKMPQVRP